MLVLRSLRLFRLGKVLRLLMLFKALWLMIQGMLACLPYVFYTFAMIALIIYVYGILGYELITESSLAVDPDLEELVRKHFPDLPGVMLTLVAFVNCDSASAIYEPLIKADWSLFFYFTSFILF